MATYFPFALLLVGLAGLCVVVLADARRIQRQVEDRWGRQSITTYVVSTAVGLLIGAAGIALLSKYVF